LVWTCRSRRRVRGGGARRGIRQARARRREQGGAEGCATVRKADAGQRGRGGGGGRGVRFREFGGASQKRIGCRIRCKIRRGAGARVRSESGVKSGVKSGEVQRRESGVNRVCKIRRDPGPGDTSPESNRVRRRTLVRRGRCRRAGSAEYGSEPLTRKQDSPPPVLSTASAEVLRKRPRLPAVAQIDAAYNHPRRPAIY
jgi:hypothetical protein